MSIPETITSAIVAMATLSLPVILGFLLHSAINLRKDMNRDMQSLRQDMHREIQNLREDMHQNTQALQRDMSAMNSRLGRIEGRLFGVDPPSSA